MNLLKTFDHQVLRHSLGVQLLSRHSRICRLDLAVVLRHSLGVQLLSRHSRICRLDLAVYYYEPVSGKRFQSKPDVLHFLETGGRCKRSTGGDATTPNSKKQKKSSLTKEEKKTTSSYSDSLNPPQSVCWVLTDSSAETLTPFIHGNMIPEGQRQEWDAVFSTVSQRNANRDAGVYNHRDLIVVDGFLHWRRKKQKVFHLNTVHDVQVILSQVRAMEAVTNACVGVDCLYCTILGVAPEV
ncbi:hypothetical protein CQW23_32646 [Capsicum baccatum]|uniref:Uncharacterized protein n=1 Tax=Capsicum baccatum TaxID=33114 RepID=A0A2G2V443_CAPBA|nr:hypothetical protein CQW23_32646 [Capsicum baccatum]